MSENDNEAANWFAEHPKMIGALFTLLLLLSQAGTAAASAGNSIAGP